MLWRVPMMGMARPEAMLLRLQVRYMIEDFGSFKTQPEPSLLLSSTSRNKNTRRRPQSRFKRTNDGPEEETKSLTRHQQRHT